MFGGYSLDTHLKAKETIQKVYFGMEELDDSVFLIGTIGRIAEQKQIHLILEAVEPLIRAMGGKVQVMIAGNAPATCPYGKLCSEKVKVLRAKYPKNFWADPSLFFSEHRLHVFHGCDFGIMFSKFEPGGLVHLEFFAAGTPMIATKTGGLKDTITELTPGDLSGSGVFINSNQASALVTASVKAKSIWEDKTFYSNLRSSMYNKALDTKEGALKYLEEFCRLKDKIFNDIWSDNAQSSPSSLESSPKDFATSEHEDARVFTIEDPSVKKLMAKGSWDNWVHYYELTRLSSTKWRLDYSLPAGLHSISLYPDQSSHPHLDITAPIIYAADQRGVNTIEISEKI